jgi:hypothetical protein
VHNQQVKKVITQNKINIFKSMQREFNRLKVKDYISTLSQMPYESELEYSQRRVSTVMGLDIKLIKALPLVIFQDYEAKLKEVENTLKGYKLKNKIKIGGKWFKVENDIMKITAAQFIDASAFSKVAEKELHKFIAVFLRPMSWRFGKVQDYDGTNHKEISELVFQEMKMKDAQALLVFFCKVLNRLSIRTETYLLEVAENLIKDLQASGGILSQSTIYPTEMQPNGNTSLK